MDNRDQVAALVDEGVRTYAEWRVQHEQLLGLRELVNQAERVLHSLETRRDTITLELKKLSYHDVGHAKGELKKNADNPGA